MSAPVETLTALPGPPRGREAAASGGVPPQRRPRLVAAARRLWRDAQTLQLGRSPGVVLAGLDPAARAVLPLLDGTRDHAEVLRAGAAHGCSPDRTAQLLRLLDGAGLLEDAGRAAPVLDAVERERLAPDHAALSLLRGDAATEAVARRSGTRVRVVGAGRVGAALCALLRAAGVGAVDVVDGGTARVCDAGAAGLLPADAGRRRDEAAAERAAPAAGAGPRGRPDLVALAPARPHALETDVAALPPGVPHLLAEVRDTVGAVGPLVVPGTTACLRCLDLTRTDLDPGWPALAAQLAVPRRGDEACDAVLAVAVASQACLQLLAVVDGSTAPATLDGTLELALPDWRWRRRSWSPHPDCGCGAAG